MRFLTGIFFLIALYSCNSTDTKNPKIIEESDKWVKKLEEHDSIRIIGRDSSDVRTVLSDTI